MNKLAVAALTFALAAVPRAVLADPNPASYPKFVPGTNNAVLWPSHDYACDKDMDNKKWDSALGNVSLKPGDPDAGTCVKALVEYDDVIETLSHVKAPLPIILRMGANAAMTETEIAWALHAEGDDDSGQVFAKGALGLWHTAMESTDKFPDSVTEEFTDMIRRLEAIYPKLVEADMNGDTPGDPGMGNPDPDPSPTL